MTIAERAVQVELGGWDGLLVPDSQGLLADTYVMLAVAAAATSTVQIGTGVTNPYTRHAAITASAIASVQAVSGGRAVLGVGRGDSSLAHLGYAPASPAYFERFLDRVQAYLRGELVTFEAAAEEGIRPVDDLHLAGSPAESGLLWLDPTLPKVPVDVVATGPKVIRMAAVKAERLTFALGADPERLSWAVDIARKARTEAGLDPDELSFGCYIPFVTHPDADVARSLNAVGVATLARFSVMHGRPAVPVDDASKAELERLAAGYDMKDHGAGAAAHRNVLSQGFADAFGIAGTPDQCVERAIGLEGLGLDRIVVLPALSKEVADLDDVALSRTTMQNEVIPALRG
ncbi:LLM class flavin-dependent oxidoreductase [Pseudonocardia alaniniphila]|uniref:LLM class flavin-dependent oxidoreductase n=1 Tax=Pseudonocardia alaniniphila TaxID=75291 RepID=A0ABS9T9A2_9PSEU|nr:LLM class flavin-dependent oxidoreductase [Pseudonocardia alaniniphila]MCH6165110.1 LLM class flavin-dependent oxidoreductase [Pseudonocardia alaniniphila]